MFMASKMNLESILNKQTHKYFLIINFMMVALMALFYKIEDIKEEILFCSWLMFQTRSTLNISIVYFKLFKKITKNNQINLERYENIMSNIKSSFISINRTKLMISYNESFTSLVEQLDSQELRDCFFIENYETTNNSNGYQTSPEFITFLVQYELNDLFVKEEDSQKLKNRKHKFIRQLFFLNKIFKCLKNKGTEEQTDFSICFKCSNFEKKQKFGNLGNFSLDTKSNETMFYEFTYRKSIVMGVEIIDIILNDITKICQIVAVKADNKYRKSYLSNVAHEFKAPIQILLET